MDLEYCIKFVKDKFKGQKRKQGTPAYTHPLAVYNILKENGFGEEYQVAGLFHDLLEDTDATEEEILKLSNSNVLEVVKLLTKTDGYIMSEYIGNISKNNIAKIVKIVDRIHNLTEAVQAPYKFQKRYIKESEDWFVELAKGTVFEKEFQKALENLKNSISFER